jgi:hypothetical protein
MGLDFPGETYQQQFLLADIALTGRPCADNEAVICTSPRGVVVVGRMPNGTYRLVATMPPGARIPQHPDRAQIGRLLTERGIDANRPPTRCGRRGFGSTTGPRPGSAGAGCCCAVTPPTSTALPPVRA